MSDLLDPNHGEIIRILKQPKLFETQKEIIGEKVAKLHQSIKRYREEIRKMQKKIIKTESEQTNVQTEKKLKMPISQQMLF